MRCEGLTAKSSGPAAKPQLRETHNIRATMRKVPLSNNTRTTLKYNGCVGGWRTSLSRGRSVPGARREAACPSTQSR